MGGDLSTRRGTRRLCVEEEQWQDDSDEAEGEEPAPAVQVATAHDAVMTKSAPTAAPAES